VRQPLRVGDPGPDWVALPWSRSPRWFLPREPPENTRAALSVYHPVTARSRAGWEVARLIAGRGLFQLRRGYGLLPKEVWEAAAPLIPPGGGLGVARANHPGRYVCLVIGNGREEPRAFIKIARDTMGSEALRREGEALEAWGGLLPLPLRAPKVLKNSPGALVLEPFEWVPRAAPWRMDVEVAHALGRFFRMTSSEQDPLSGVGHGDCAPWNLLRTRAGEWALLDWESASPGTPPFFDLFHFFVQASAELRRPTKRAIVEGLELRGWVGRTIEAYAKGCEIDSREARRLFPEYLRLSMSNVTPSAPARAVRIRSRLARMMDARQHSG
jgi:hypothetical protein